MTSDLRTLRQADFSISFIKKFLFEYLISHPQEDSSRSRHWVPDLSSTSFRL